MKPDKTPRDFYFNFDAIPLWIKPDLWDETKPVKWRGFYFVFLYIISVAVFGAYLFVPVGFYKGLSEIGTTIVMWLVLSLFSGFFLGIFSWWEFVVRSRKMSVDVKVPKDNKGSSGESSDDFS